MHLDIPFSDCEMDPFISEVYRWSHLGYEDRLKQAIQEQETLDPIKKPFGDLESWNLYLFTYMKDAFEHLFWHIAWDYVKEERRLLRDQEVKRLCNWTFKVP